MQIIHGRFLQLAILQRKQIFTSFVKYFIGRFNTLEQSPSVYLIEKINRLNLIKYILTFPVYFHDDRRLWDTNDSVTTHTSVTEAAVCLAV